ncbi:hypothetical protein INR49_028775, partial [Caranx melampygus]
MSTEVSEENFLRFVCKNNGVIFENQLLQIGLKSEYRQNLGRMYVFYGNKTSTQFLSFTSSLNVHAKAVDSLIEGGAQVQQILNIECLSDFTDAPVLNVQFRYGGTLQNIAVKLPIMLNNPQQEVQKIFKAKHPMDTDVTKAKKRSSDLLLESCVPHHEGNELGRVRPVQVAQDGHDVFVELLLLIGWQLHQNLRQRLELTSGHPAAQETSCSST